MSEKIIGYILLVIGIGIILFAAFDVFLLFTKQKQPVSFFSFPGISLNMANFLPKDVSAQLSQFGMNPSQGMNQEIIPANMINLTSNIFIHLFFMGFFATIGVKIATVGTYLIRTITVNLKETAQK